MRRRLVLLTGADGKIGTGFREEYHAAGYAESYDLRLGVREAGFRDDRFDDIAVIDLEKPESLRGACRGVDTVVHLAANADPAAAFEELLGPNVVGLYHLLEAARETGCARVVFASSVHAIMGHPPDLQAHHDDPPWPDTIYGATKVFGEALCAAFAHLHGLSCIAVRIGDYVGAEDVGALRRSSNARPLDMVVTQRDMGQLLHRCIVAGQGIRYTVVNGVSDNRYKRMDIEQARALLGYEPQDDAFRLSQQA